MPGFPSPLIEVVFPKNEPVNNKQPKPGSVKLDISDSDLSELEKHKPAGDQPKVS